MVYFEPSMIGEVFVVVKGDSFHHFVVQELVSMTKWYSKDRAEFVLCNGTLTQIAYPKHVEPILFGGN